MRPGIEARAFGLEDTGALMRALADVDVVIHAAGPFARTAEPMLRACLRSACHYVDINGEIDVYERLRALCAGDAVMRADVAVVSGTGYTPAAADLVVAAALATSSHEAHAPCRRLSTVRVCHSRISSLSRGSMATALRMLAQPVVVAQDAAQGPHAGGSGEMRLVPEPVGRLERVFQFAPIASTTGEAQRAPPRRLLGSAVSLVDTSLLRSTIEAAGCCAARIESYVEMSGWQRTGYQVGAWAAPLAAGRASVASAIDALPVDEDGAWHAVVVEIDDDLEEPLIRWQLDTRDVYAFSAEAAVAVAAMVTRGAPSCVGWLTPSQALSAGKRPASLATSRWHMSRLTQRG